MRIIFAGTPEAAVPTLKALLSSSHEVALDGPAAQVRQVAEQVIREGGAELVGTVVRAATREGEENEVRTLVRTPLAGAASMLAVLTGIRRSRSARKVPLVKMSVNPPELF